MFGTRGKIWEAREIILEELVISQMAKKALTFQISLIIP